MSRTSKRPLFAVVAGVLGPLYRVAAAAQWHGIENLPASGGFVIAPNHLTELDPVTVGYPVYRAGIMPRFLAKESLFRVPVVGALLRGMGHVPVYRWGPRAKDSLEAAFAELADGGVIVVYPEGTVTRDPEMWPMRAHTGAAQRAEVTADPQGLAEIAGDRRRPLPRLDTGAGLADLFVGQDAFAPFVLAFRLGDSDALSLAFTDDGPLAPGERPEQRKHQIGSRILGAGGVGSPFMDKLHTRALGSDLTNDLLEIDQGTSESVH